MGAVNRFSAGLQRGQVRGRSDAWRVGIFAPSDRAHAPRPIALVRLVINEHDPSNVNADENAEPPAQIQQQPHGCQACRKA